MKNRNQNQQGGFIQIIIIVIIFLLILHFLGISLARVLSMQWVRDMFIYLIDLAKIIWQDLLIFFSFLKDLITQGH